MNYESVKEVAEVDTNKQVNAYLRLGWKLLGIATMNTDSEEYSEPIIKYSLGWEKEEKPVYPEKSV